MFINISYTASTAKSKQSFLLKVFLSSYFLMFLAPTLKGEHQKIRLPSGLRGKADFHLLLTKYLPCGIPLNAKSGQQNIINTNPEFISHETK
jgi:hypothetical protein